MTILFELTDLEGEGSIFILGQNLPAQSNRENVMINFDQYQSDREVINNIDRALRVKGYRAISRWYKISDRTWIADGKHDTNNATVALYYVGECHKVESGFTSVFVAHLKEQIDIPDTSKE